MPISESERRLVLESLPTIRAHLEPVSMVFYENLFAIRPDMRALFREDLGGQGMRFMTTLTTIAGLLDDPEAFDAMIEKLSRGHAMVGVREDHFAPMGSALLVTLGETLGSDFDSGLQAAWRTAYDEVAAAMLARGRFGRDGADEPPEDVARLGRAGT
jgi:hemoglobin-like flavoprotein